jgi:hypothetical protein
MHCPNCGTDAPASQKFCRACGLSLDRFAQLLAELLPDVEDENLAQARQRLRILKKAGKIAGTVGALAIWLFFTLAGIFIINKGHTGPGILLLMLGFGSIATFWIANYYDSLYKKVTAQPPSQYVSLSAETTNKLLLEDPSRIAPAITEHTTAKLGGKVSPLDKKP